MDSPSESHKPRQLCPWLQGPTSSLLPGDTIYDRPPAYLGHVCPTAQGSRELQVGDVRLAFRLHPFPGSSSLLPRCRLGLEFPAQGEACGPPSSPSLAFLWASPEPSQG